MLLAVGVRASLCEVADRRSKQTTRSVTKRPPAASKQFEAMNAGDGRVKIARRARAEALC